MTIKELFTRKNQFATRNVGPELVLVPLRNNVADMNELYTMNESGSFIWELIDGKNTEEEIVAALMEQFDVDERTAREDLDEFIGSVSEMIAKS